MLKKLILLFVMGVMTYATPLKIVKNRVVDYKQNSVPLTKYNKILILDPAVVEIFYEIGAQNKIVAIGKGSHTKIYPQDLTEKLPNVGHMVKANFENILKYNPDLVVLNPMNSKIKEKLDAFHIPYIINKSANLNDVVENIKIYGILTDHKKIAENYSKKLQTKLANLKKEIKKNPLNLKGAVIYSSSPMMAFKDNSLAGQILKLLGVENIANNLMGARPILSPEYLIEQNPDFIVGLMSIKSANDISKGNLAVQSTNAYKNNNIFLVDTTKTMRGSGRIVDGAYEFYTELRKRVKK